LGRPSPTLKPILRVTTAGRGRLISRVLGEDPALQDLPDPLVTLVYEVFPVLLE